MGKFYIYNDLETGIIIVREGNGSTFFPVINIQPGEHYVVQVDSKATNREYLLAVENLAPSVPPPDPSGPERVEAKFTSDECLECSEIRITRDDNSKLVFKTVPRVLGIYEKTTDANLSHSWQSFSNFITKLFGKGERRTAAVSQPQSPRHSSPTTAPQPQLPNHSSPAPAPRPLLLSPSSPDPVPMPQFPSNRSSQSLPIIRSN